MDKSGFRLDAGPDKLIELPFMPGDELMTPGEVASLFRVDPQTVHDWTIRKGSKMAKIVIWTPGGHARYPAAKVRAIWELLNATD